MTMNPVKNIPMVALMMLKAGTTSGSAFYHVSITLRDGEVTYQDQDIPIESRNRVVSKTIDRSDDIIENLVVGCNPGHPVESRQGKEDVIGELDVSTTSIQKRKDLPRSK
jgi:hypothetical protein